MWMLNLAGQGRDIQEVHGLEQASNVKRALEIGLKLP